jgi:cytochrome c oxidase subunit II
MKRLLLSAATLVLAGCTGPQSAFAPRGEEAERITILFWSMTIGGGLILLLVCVLTALAIFGTGRVRSWLGGEGVIRWLGIAMPVVVLTVLFVSGLLLMRVDGAAPGQLRIAISGEQWWWRVTYIDAQSNRFESANELHLPVGVPVTLELTSPDVIHGLWAPSLAGKLDMIPGRTNTMTVTASEPGITRGQCAEYCGGAHAFMSFHVVAHEPDDYQTWLADQAAPSVVPGDEALERGQALFLATGCGGCHAVRGTEADGGIGPDLTHLGSRHSLAAATLPNTPEAIAAFITNNQHIKPENRMPEYGIFTPEELADLSAYLGSLK